MGQTKPTETRDGDEKDRAWELAWALSDQELKVAKAQRIAQELQSDETEESADPE